MSDTILVGIARKDSWTCSSDFGYASSGSDADSGDFADYLSDSNDEAEENNMNDDIIKIIEGLWN
jgi:hypothetical protein